MRLSPTTDKKDCKIIDFVDSNNRVVDVISIPTLLGLDPNLISLDDETFESLDRISKSSQHSLSGSAGDELVPQLKSVSYTEYDDPFSFVHNSDGAPHITKLSPNAWVGCGGGVYILECLGKVVQI
jgi:ATP-dependent helicase IRC3